ncbi:nucleotide-binding universal stress UspA family protein [Winogradskyella eximia]|jgi:nucleotide-binding universal stress UspA family protein|uniref:Nucleotide-binding universal stress UspA family protein n=1 Tax=Winogradskyella eximia TaxID=262006 RepID=A0A3D9H2Y2_9FLAO|nr:universal stress protein [Winogradskyella eximia]RED43840.1 nucleotide-binding universal stress UspA family protein [Winogradskyella eximia]
MKKNILLPTDFSDNAWSAVVYALKLYEEELCTFYFLHSTKMKVSTMSNMSNKLLRVMAENAMNELSELKELAETSNANANHSFEIILSSNDLFHSMETIIEKNNIDMVVMGTKGATGAKEIVFGSNTVNSIKKIKNCPVLAVPDEFDFVIPEQIAFPTDFNRLYGAELQPLLDLADLYNSKIRVLHINKEDSISEAQDYNLDQLKVALENYEYSFHWMPDYSKKDEAIKDFIDELNINILVMINYKHSFIESLVKEPVIKKLGFQPTIPFLVIPD